MNDHTSIQYAIRLPNGALAEYVPFEVYSGSPKSQTLPGGESVLLWPEGEAERARKTIDSLAGTVDSLGLSELFTDRAQVVMVRTTVEILDGDSEQDERDEPRTWRHLSDIPVNVTFEARLRQDANGRPRIFTKESERSYGDAESGVVRGAGEMHYTYSGVAEFVEVLPEEAERRKPRTWEKAEDIPVGVRVKPIGGDIRFGWERHPMVADQFIQFWDGRPDGVTTAASLTESWPDGFMEVLS